MSRKRSISTSISVDKNVNRLAQRSDFAALLYSWMIPHAEDDALIHTGDPEEILATVVPMRRDKDVEDVVAALGLMESLGLIVWHDDCIEFPSEAFYRYQTYVKADRRRGSPLVCRCHRHSETGGEVPRSSENVGENAASVSSSSSHSHSHSPPGALPVDNCPPDIDPADWEAALRLVEEEKSRGESIKKSEAAYARWFINERPDRVKAERLKRTSMPEQVRSLLSVKSIEEAS